MNIAEMLAEMSGEKNTTSIMPLAAVHRLREALPSVDGGKDFKRGDVVRQREGFAVLTSPTKAVPGIFVDYVDGEQEWDEPGGFADCVVLTILRDEVCMFRVPAWRLEIYPEEEL